MKYCYKCGQLGHIAVDCNQKAVSFNGGPPRLPNPGGAKRRKIPIKARRAKFNSMGYIECYEDYQLMLDQDTNTAEEIEEEENNLPPEDDPSMSF